MSDLVIRPPTAADRTWLRAANNAEVPNVNHLDDADLSALLAQAALVRIAARAAGPLGTVVAFAPGADYASANYRWFCRRYPAFLYVDRVVVDPQARGRGVGRALYDAVIAAAEAGHGGRVTCEVNLDPPNPGSMAFHARLGFREVARRDNDGKTVAMLLRGPDADGA
jgi:hypothetical protein